MPASVLDTANALRAALATFDPRLLSGTDSARLAEELAATEKACASARLLAAARAVEAGAHRERGYSDGAAWLARQSGTTASRARQALDTAGRLDEHPETKQALLGGEISLEQAREITEAPGGEKDLLAAARHGDLTEVRHQAREFRQAHTDPVALRRRQFELREFRHWQDGEGMVRFTGALPPESGLPLVRRVEKLALALRKAVKQKSGTAERFDAYAADALAQLVVSGGGTDSKLNVDLSLVCDLNAWRRGHAQKGEPCHIIGGGPIPVDVLKELARDSFLQAVIHDGEHIHIIKRFGRYLPVALRAAMDLGSPPEFKGRCCTACGKLFGLERDHEDPVANGGPTEHSNLQDLCYLCHKKKTEEDRKAGRLGPGAQGRKEPVPSAQSPPDTS